MYAKNTNMLNMRTASALFVAMLIIAATMFSAYQMGVLNPGFEGAKCYFYGADFRFNSDWTGTYALHRYQDAENPLVSHSAQVAWVTASDKIYWTTVGTPNDAGFGWQYKEQGVTTMIREKPVVGIHVESNIQLEEISRQGDPLNWNASSPMDARRIEYYSKTLVSKVETNKAITYSYKVTKESFIITPAEFWVGFYLIPSQQNTGGTGSGWREGEWQNIVVWFMLDFTVWDNAYADAWLDDPKLNVFDSVANGTIANQKRLTDYRGGFPIAAWIQGWEKGGWSKFAWETGAVSNPQTSSPSWLQTRGKENKIYSVEELADIKDKLMSKVQFAPDKIGQFLSLYDSPNAAFEYRVDMSQSGFSGNDALVKDVKSPDSRMKKTMYFPINIINFGTYCDGDWWNGYRVFYPSAYFRVRTIYGVYGTFTYLWTEEVSKPDTPSGAIIKYPNATDIEREETVVIHEDGMSAWVPDVGGFFSNPLVAFWLIFFIVAIIVIVVVAANPGLMAIIASRYGKPASSRKRKE